MASCSGDSRHSVLAGAMAWAQTDIRGPGEGTSDGVWTHTVNLRVQANDFVEAASDVRRATKSAEKAGGCLRSLMLCWAFDGPSVYGPVTPAKRSFLENCGTGIVAR